ncbi:MAG: autotransporter-associated beta strand repeat-containing protein [Ignavibacteria bacterium]|nr:autotransporter-associated beta strand repeat-containing protein [Ignavibacteria bacterium]
MIMKLGIGKYLLISLLLIYSVRGQSFLPLYDFTGGATSGSNPYGTLLYSGGLFYGMTQNGGTDNVGIIFKINPDGSSFTILHHFTGSATDGSSPSGSLIIVGGVLYGMTDLGGASNRGTIFSINTNGTGFSLLYSFVGGGADGKNPMGGLIESGGVLYGMTSSGTSGNKGNIFKINTNGTGYTVLHLFGGGSSDGASPYGDLVLSGGVLYGMTSSGGTQNRGVIFKINTDGTGFALIRDLVGGATDGSAPYGSLNLIGGVLYGMNSNGGTQNRGVIFSLNTDGSGFNLMHSFAGGNGDGDNPHGSMIQVGATLYGMTNQGGASNAGVIFSINTDGSGYTVIASMSDGGSNKNTPNGSLVFIGTVMYGMTANGGGSNRGTIFGYDPIPTLSATVSASPNTGVVAVTLINFTTTVTGGLGPFTYSHTHGDGVGVSALQNPSYTYPTPGVYTETVTVTDARPVSTQATCVVTILPPPLLVNLNPSAVTGTAGVTAFTFTTTASGGWGAYTYAHTFGDGGTSVAQNPVYIYAADGVYTETVTVTDALGATAQASVGITVNPLAGGALTVTYSVAPASGSSDVTSFAFTTNVVGGSPPYTYSHNFGDGNTSTLQNPSHIYHSSGIFMSTVTVTDAVGTTAQASLRVAVDIPPPAPVPTLSVSLIANPLNGTEGVTAINFTTIVNSGTPPYTYSHNFGDGSTSAAQNPSYTYPAASVYNSLVTVTDGAGLVAQASVRLIILPAVMIPLSVSISVSPLSGQAAVTAFAFTTTPAGGLPPYTYLHTFGDGQTSTSQNPTHIYAAIGTYTETVTVTDGLGSTAQATTQVVVNVEAPIGSSTKGRVYMESLPIPTLSEWAAILMGILLGIYGIFSIRKMI